MPGQPRRSGAPAVVSDVTGSPSPGGKRPGATRARLGVMPWVWGGGLIALVLAAILVTVSVLPSLNTVDRSTPHATVSGYYDALRARDYTRAWQYLAASRNSVTSETDFARNLRADDDHNGHVLSVHIGDLPQDNSGHASGTVSVVRSLAASTPRLYTIVLTQYGEVWLIDSVTSEG
ncbi:MAG: hypothetical protein PVSMB4_01110 [Ktedonobacterales bacterium]